MKLQRLFGIIILIGLIAGISILILSGSSTKYNNSAGLQVVAAENFWGNIASQIGGSHVQVTSIITNPTDDPHLYESNAQNASIVGSADVVIVNGLGYDDFMTKLLGTSHNSDRAVLSAATILNASDVANPHLWYDIPRINILANKIAATFSEKDPSHTSDYVRNAKTFNASLTPLLETMQSIAQSYLNAPVAYTERVPEYILVTSKLDIKTPRGFSQAIEDGENPSPSDSSAMDALITGHHIRLLLYNSQATSAVTEQVKKLAVQSNIPVVGVTETMPNNQSSYQSWQQNQLNQIQKALKK